MDRRTQQDIMLARWVYSLYAVVCAFGVFVMLVVAANSLNIDTQTRQVDPQWQVMTLLLALCCLWFTREFLTRRTMTMGGWLTVITGGLASRMADAAGGGGFLYFLAALIMAAGFGVLAYAYWLRLQAVNARRE
jgi:hypothetical protein